ncbi:YlzJ-like family protein [Syntrophomonas erecta]
MIYYIPDPNELFQADKLKNTIVMKTPSGAKIEAVPCGYNEVRVIKLLSTDPMDYLNKNYQPGSIITMEARLDQ